jgi:hypothetical protein
MRDDIFEACLKNKKEYDGNNPFWQGLADGFGYQSKNAIRKAFNRECDIRGISDEDIDSENRHLPRIAVMDIENLPPRGFPGWGMRDQYITPDMIEDDPAMLSWAGMALDGTEVVSDVLTPREARKYDSRRITESISEYINNFDFILGFNWDGFDGKVITTELTVHHLPPLQYRSIDLYLLLRRYYRLPSYKLAFVNKKFQIREKQPNEGFMLWRRCSHGEQDALLEMESYNKQDVIATADLFWTIQPYVNGGLPNLSIYDESNIVMTCNCGSTRFEDAGFHFTNGAKFERLRCRKCGAVHRKKKNLLEKQKMQSTLVRL